MWLNLAQLLSALSILKDNKIPSESFHRLPCEQKRSNFYPSAKISKTNTTKINVTRKEKRLKGGENKERKFENKIFPYLNCPHSAVLGKIFCLPKELRKNIHQISIPIPKLGM